VSSVDCVEPGTDPRTDRELPPIRRFSDTAAPLTRKLNLTGVCVRISRELRSSDTESWASRSPCELSISEASRAVSSKVVSSKMSPPRTKLGTPGQAAQTREVGQQLSEASRRIVRLVGVRGVRLLVFLVGATMLGSDEAISCEDPLGHLMRWAPSHCYSGAPESSVTRSGVVSERPDSLWVPTQTTGLLYLGAAGRRRRASSTSEEQVPVGETGTTVESGTVERMFAPPNTSNSVVDYYDQNQETATTPQLVEFLQEKRGDFVALNLVFGESLLLDWNKRHGSHFAQYKTITGLQLPSPATSTGDADTTPAMEFDLILIEDSYFVDLFLGCRPGEHSHGRVHDKASKRAVGLLEHAVFRGYSRESEAESQRVMDLLHWCSIWASAQGFETLKRVLDERACDCGGGTGGTGTGATPTTLDHLHMRQAMHSGDSGSGGGPP